MCSLFLAMARTLPVPTPADKHDLVIVIVPFRIVSRAVSPPDTTRHDHPIHDDEWRKLPLE